MATINRRLNLLISISIGMFAVIAILAFMIANYRPLKRRYYGTAARASWSVKIEPFGPGKVQPGWDMALPSRNTAFVIPEPPSLSPLERVISEIQLSVGIVNMYILTIFFGGINLAFGVYWFLWSRNDHISLHKKKGI